VYSYFNLLNITLSTNLSLESGWKIGGGWCLISGDMLCVESGVNVSTLAISELVLISFICRPCHHSDSVGYFRCYEGQGLDSTAVV